MRESIAYRVLLAVSPGLNATLFGAGRQSRRQPSRSPASPLPSPTSFQVEAKTQAEFERDRPSQFLSSVRLQFSTVDARIFAAALAVFLVTRLAGLDRFPIYFFSDEAIQAVAASDFVRDGLRDHTGELFPTYFLNNESYNLSVSVYAQVLPVALFGLTIFVTRGTSVLIAFSGMIAAGLILKRAFRIRFWWTGVLLLSITPAWFLHSRTSFETALATTFYIWFLYFYLRYRDGRPRALPAALLFGALAFYTYSPMQVAVVLSGLLLSIVDARYHWQNRRAAATGLGVLAILVLPYLRFMAGHPNESFLRLRLLDSYLLRQDMTPEQKFERFGHEYTYGLSPAFWYIPDNDRDLIRHKMKGYGNILPVTLPFALAGLLIAIRHIRTPAYRTALIALLAAPAGAALVEVHVTRALVFVVPAALLTAAGLAAVLNRLSWLVPYHALAWGVFGVLAAGNLAMLDDALRNGATWYDDYHIGGLQYGAKEVFQEMRAILERSPDTQVLLSPTWANGTDTLLRFFMPGEPRAQILNIDAFIDNLIPLSDDMLLIMPPDEYERARVNPKFTGVRVEQTLKYPDGRDGFYFVRLRYSPEAAQIFETERQARREPIVEEFTLDGEAATISHTLFDIGQLSDLFDRDTFSLARTRAVNPAVIDITFSEPRQVAGLTLTTGTKDFTLTVQLFGDGDEATATYTQTYRAPPPDPTVELEFDASADRINRIRIEVHELTADENGNVHIREIALR